MEAIKRADMNFEEARAACETIRRGLGEVCDLAIDLRDRMGWKALGYSSWNDCVTKEFGVSKQHINRQLAAAEVQLEVEPIGSTQKIPESQLRPLVSVERGQRAEVWKEAKATAPEGKITAKHVKETVDRKAGKPKPDPAPEIPRSQFKTEINGQFAPDPPAIAKLRAAGKIGAGVVVEITEPEPDEEPETAPTPEATPGEPEEEWLANLPLSSMLTGMSLAIFQSDAKRFYRMRKARDAFRSLHSSAGKGLRKDGCYFDRISKFLTIADPRDWIRCTTPDNGGCSGTGLLTTHGGGACPKCFGRGYTIDNRRDWRKLA